MLTLINTRKHYNYFFVFFSVGFLPIFFYVMAPKKIVFFFLANVVPPYTCVNYLLITWMVGCRHEDESSGKLKEFQKYYQEKKIGSSWRTVNQKRQKDV